MTKRFTVSKQLIEGLVLILFFFTLVHLGGSTLLQERITHEFPHGYYASDAYWQLIYTTHIYEVGDYQYRPFYDSLGYTDVQGVLPPMAYQLSAAFAHLTDLQPYDTLIFLVILFFSFSAMIMYLIIRQFNRDIALLSLPVMALLMAQPNFPAITWGKHLVIMGGFFLVASFWMVTGFRDRPHWALLSVFLGATLLSHPPEYLFALAFLVGVGIVLLFKRQLKVSDIKRWVYAALGGLLLALPYALVFYGTLWKKAGGTVTLFKVIPSIGYPVFQPDYFVSLIGATILIGMVLLSLQWFLRWRTDPKRTIIILMSFYMLFLGLANYVGLQERSFQQRYFWPIYLSLFFGFAIYALLSGMSRFLPIKPYRFWIILGIVLLGSWYIIDDSYQASPHPGLMDAFHWEAFTWVKEKTPEDARVLYVYGDTFDQKPILLMGERRSYLVELKPFLQELQSGKITSAYSIQEIMSGDANLAYRTGLVSFGSHLFEDKPIATAVQSLCSFDYLVFDKASRAPQIIQVTMQIRQALLEQNSIDEVFSNQLVSILENKQPGGACYVERPFQLTQ